MSTTGPYKPASPVAGTDITTLGFGLPVVRAINWLQGTPAAGDEERPFAVLRQTVAQSIATATATAISFDAEDIDTVGGHSTVTNTSRWTCPAGHSGWFHATALYVAASNATGVRQAFLRVNGNNSPRYGQMTVNANASFESAVNVSDRFFLNAGDYVELCGYQSSGGNLNTNLSPGTCRLTIRMERAQ